MSRTTSYLLRPLVLVMLAAVAAFALGAVALGAASPAARAEDGNCQPSGNEVVCTFETPGSWTWTVPRGAAQATFEVFGAQGGAGGQHGFPDNGQPGLGGEAKATFDLQPTSQLQVNVGGQGQAGSSGGGTGGQGGLNGGANGGDGNSLGGGGGGGSSDVRFDTDVSGDFSLAERIIVAGGGGGASGSFFCSYIGSGGAEFDELPGAAGGDGGGTTGNPGSDDIRGAPVGGGGGTESTGGVGASFGPGTGNDGDLGIGGTGGTNTSPCELAGGASGGGGGGGGYYGGGGGSSNVNQPVFGAGGGGGGSGFVSPEGANKLMQTGVNSGAGKVTITYTPDTTSPTVVQDATSPTPQPEATGVRRSTTVKASFSEAMRASTLNSNVQLFSGKSTRPIKATLSWEPSTKPTSVTLTPASKLDAKTRYTAKIKGGETGVKDLADNPLTSDYIWTFTTGSM